MEQTKNTTFNENSESCGCNNGYTSQEMFMESFGKDDESISKCNGCSSFIYNCGIAGCKKFS